MSDLEERLRACGDCGSGCVGPMQEAAATLAQLRDLEYYYDDACKRIEAVREWAERLFPDGPIQARNELLAILNRSNTDVSPLLPQ